MNTYSEFSEVADLVESTLVYYDAPLEGHLRLNRTGALYVFRRHPLATDALWHWTLLPIGEELRPVEVVFGEARRKSPEHWISVVEDRRGATPTVTVARLDAKRAPSPFILQE